MQERDYFPYPSLTPAEKRPKKGISKAVFIVALIVAILVSSVLSFFLTSSYYLDACQAIIDEDEAYYESLIAQYKEQVSNAQSASGYDELDLLRDLVKSSSLYADKTSEEDRMNAVLKAYMAATGDDYAEYYTEAEYEALSSDNEGNYQGIGVTVLQTKLTLEGITYMAFEVSAINKNSPCNDAGLKIGDYILLVQVDGEYKTIAELGGYTSALNHIRGEAGTNAVFRVLRYDDNKVSYSLVNFTVERQAITKETVTYHMIEGTTVGYVLLTEFDLVAPTQYKEAILALQNLGATSFIVDVRNNPGGDLKSIQAILSYHLHTGDLILTEQDKDGNVLGSVKVQPFTYGSLTVSKDDVGIFSGLTFTVLCNGNSASAAEVFVGDFQDYNLGKVIGTKTFGKGIMQSIYPLSYFGNYKGYIKLTTCAFVTKRGTSYHGVGLTPDYVVELSDEAKSYSIYNLPASIDAQLQKALEILE